MPLEVKPTNGQITIKNNGRPMSCIAVEEGVHTYTVLYECDGDTMYPAAHAHFYLLKNDPQTNRPFTSDLRQDDIQVMSAMLTAVV